MEASGQGSHGSVMVQTGLKPTDHRGGGGDKPFQVKRILDRRRIHLSRQRERERRREKEERGRN